MSHRFSTKVQATIALELLLAVDDAIDTAGCESVADVHELLARLILGAEEASR